MKAPYGVGPGSSSSGSTGGGSGFFSTIKEVGSDVVGEVGNMAKKNAPNWTAKALKSQMNSQLANSTFNRKESPKRMGGFAQTTGGNAGPKVKKAGVQGGTTQNALWDTYKGLNISGATAALLAITAGVVAFAVFK